MVHAYCQQTLCDYISGFKEREEERERQEKLGEEARALLKDRDFEDRLMLFVADLLSLSENESWFDLPHSNEYFESAELEILKRCSRIGDRRATPSEILLSLEEHFSRYRIKVNGAWKPRHEEYIHHLRTQKPVIEGTLTSPHAALLKEFRLEREEEDRLEEEEQKRLKEKKKAIQQKRRETRARKKAEKESSLSSGSEKTTPDTTEISEQSDSQINSEPEKAQAEVIIKQKNGETGNPDVEEKIGDEVKLVDGPRDETTEINDKDTKMEPPQKRRKTEGKKSKGRATSPSPVAPRLTIKLKVPEH
jgi:hypothetical protein